MKRRAVRWRGWIIFLIFLAVRFFFRVGKSLELDLLCFRYWSGGLELA